MFIVLEGIDGSGKTTVAKRLAEKIHAEYREFPDRTTITGKVIDAWLRGEVFLGANEDGEEALLALTEGSNPLRADPKQAAVVLQSLMTVNKIEAMSKFWRARSGRLGVNGSLRG